MSPVSSEEEAISLSLYLSISLSLAAMFGQNLACLRAKTPTNEVRVIAPEEIAGEVGRRKASGKTDDGAARPPTTRSCHGLVISYPFQLLPCPSAYTHDNICT